jgi:hypothetical protein
MRREPRWQKRRTKRFCRLIALLEASNSDPKRRNRKTRLRELINYVKAKWAPEFERRRQLENQA